MWTKKKKPWRKNLYENNGYPDNYTDSSFLEELKTNINIQEICFREAFLGAGLITQQFSVVVNFVVLYIYLYNFWIQPETLFVQSSLITVNIYLLQRIILSKGSTLAMLAKDIKTCIIFLAFGYFLSPILKTLTETISTDTIYTTTTFMMGIHLIFFDYNESNAINSSSLSFNAAIFGSICLASRLPTPFHAFVLLTLAVECFVLLPIFLEKLEWPLLKLFGMLTFGFISLLSISIEITLYFAAAIIFLTLLCPILFLKWQKHKDNIYGPWDEAIVNEIDLE